MARRVQRSAEYHEGETAAQRFDEGMRRTLSVSKEELARREAAYKKSRRATKTRAARTTSR